MLDQVVVKKIFRRLKKANPQPTTELKYNNSFELLIAVMLSAQATDISVNKATKTLYKVARSPAGILKLGESGLKKHIQSIGLYNSKAKHIMQTCHLILEEFAGEVPQTRAELMSLPGVGRKTANVILNTAFGLPTLAVDTHIFRVAQRLGLAKAKTPDKVEQQLLNIIPKLYLKDAHHWLILHGRYVCIARKPRCASCLLADLCPYYQEHNE